MLLGVWLWGFMSGTRSSRKLEQACWDQLPYRWLTGWPRPDHHTLWRLYRDHRQPLRRRLKRTVRTAVAAGLAGLLERTASAIADLEAQNTGGDDPPPPRLPKRLAERPALQEQVQAALERVQAALERVQAEDGPERTNLTDPDATLQKGRNGGWLVGYNAQAVVAGVAAPPSGDPDEPGGLLITAADVTTDRDDHGQLVPLVDQAAATTETPLEQVRADGGYHSTANLAACAEHKPPVALLMPDPQAPAAYHKDHCVDDPATDTFTCPQGQTLRFNGQDRRRDGAPTVRRYRALKTVCDACPVRAACTTSTTKGRSITIGPDDARLRQHRAVMATVAARATYRRRKTLPEPAFGILKEQQAARRFLLRGLDHVRAEWTLLATAFNLRTLARAWRSTGRLPLPAAA